jgi:hypothetical protein
VLAVGISWASWKPVARGDSPTLLLLLLVFLGSFGPSLAAVLLTAADEGRSELKELLGPLLAWRVGIRWYLVVLLGPLAVAWVAIILDGLLGGSGLGLGGLQIPEGLHTSLILLGLLPAFLISLIFGGLRERRSVGGATPCQASGETKRPQLRLDPGRYLGTLAPSAVLYQGNDPVLSSLHPIRVVGYRSLDTLHLGLRQHHR